MNKKIIGLYQLITGVFGVLLILLSAIGKDKSEFQSEQLVLQIIIGIIAFGLFAWTGYGLLNNHRNAKRYAMLLQALQIPVLAMPGIIYKFCASSFLSVGIINGEFSFNTSLQPIEFIISTNQNGDNIYMIYLLPIVMLYGLIKSK